MVVILRGTRRAPEMVLRHEIDLADPWVRESMHPYHQELGDRGPEGVRARRRGCAAAGSAARRAIRSLVRDMRSHGLDPRGAAVVVASLADPVRVSGAHARAHAEEARLYREAVASALHASGLRVAMFLEKSVRSVAVAQLRLTGQQVDAALKLFVRQVGTPWRAPEKQAALAAWLALSRSAGRRSRCAQSGVPRTRLRGRARVRVRHAGVTSYRRSRRGPARGRARGASHARNRRAAAWRDTRRTCTRHRPASRRA